MKKIREAIVLFSLVFLLAGCGTDSIAERDAVNNMAGASTESGGGYNGPRESDETNDSTAKTHGSETIFFGENVVCAYYQENGKDKEEYFEFTSSFYLFSEEEKEWELDLCGNEITLEQRLVLDSNITIMNGTLYTSADNYIQNDGILCILDTCSLVAEGIGLSNTGELTLANCCITVRSGQGILNSNIIKQADEEMSVGLMEEGTGIIVENGTGIINNGSCVLDPVIAVNNGIGIANTGNCTLNGDITVNSGIGIDNTGTCSLNGNLMVNSGTGCTNSQEAYMELLYNYDWDSVVTGTYMVNNGTANLDNRNINLSQGTVIDNYGTTEFSLTSIIGTLTDIYEGTAICNHSDGILNMGEGNLRIILLNSSGAKGIYNEGRIESSGDGGLELSCGEQEESFYSFYQLTNEDTLNICNDTILLEMLPDAVFDVPYTSIRIVSSQAAADKRCIGIRICEGCTVDMTSKEYGQTWNVAMSGEYVTGVHIEIGAAIRAEENKELSISLNSWTSNEAVADECKECIGIQNNGEMYNTSFFAGIKGEKNILLSNNGIYCGGLSSRIDISTEGKDNIGIENGSEIYTGCILSMGTGENNLLIKNPSIASIKTDSLTTTLYNCSYCTGIENSGILTTVSGYMSIQDGYYCVGISNEGQINYAYLDCMTGGHNENETYKVIDELGSNTGIYNGGNGFILDDNREGSCLTAYSTDDNNVGISNHGVIDAVKLSLRTQGEGTMYALQNNEYGHVTVGDYVEADCLNDSGRGSAILNYGLIDAPYYALRTQFEEEASVLSDHGTLNGDLYVTTPSYVITPEGKFYN